MWKIFRVINYRSLMQLRNFYQRKFPDLWYKYYYQSDTDCLLQINALPVLPSSYMLTVQGKHLLGQLACVVCVHLYKSQFEALGKEWSVFRSSSFAAS